MLRLKALDEENVFGDIDLYELIDINEKGEAIFYLSVFKGKLIILISKKR